MEFLANVVTADFSYKQCLSSLDVTPTGCSNLDNILGGGLYSGKLTEIYGLPGVGKTQSCLSIACHVAGTHHKNVVYIDCDASFSAQRIHEIFTTRYDSSSIMKHMARIQCVKTFEIFHAFFVLEELMNFLSTEEDAFYKDVVLVVFERVAPLISPILQGPEDEGHGHGLMVKFGQALKKIAYDYNVAVLLTNHVVADSDHSYTRPALGTNWSRILDNRISLHHSEEDPTQKMMKLVKSIHLPLKDGVRIKITKSGLLDDS